eukprot:6693029-Heterocapsa_arctica.AAC.1
MRTGHQGRKHLDNRQRLQYLCVRVFDSARVTYVRMCRFLISFDASQLGLRLKTHCWAHREKEGGRPATVATATCYCLTVAAAATALLPPLLLPLRRPDLGRASRPTGDRRAAARLTAAAGG